MLIGYLIISNFNKYCSTVHVLFLVFMGKTNYDKMQTGYVKYHNQFCSLCKVQSPIVDVFQIYTVPKNKFAVQIKGV